MATLTRIQFPEEPDVLDIDAHASSVAAGAGGDQFLNTGNTGFWIKNSSGGSITVTFAAQNDCNFGETHDAAVSVPNGTIGFIASRFSAQRFNDSSGYVQVTYSGVTSVTVAAVRLD